MAASAVYPHYDANATYTIKPLQRVVPTFAGANNRNPRIQLLPNAIDEVLAPRTSAYVSQLSDALYPFLTSHHDVGLDEEARARFESDLATILATDYPAPVFVNAEAPAPAPPAQPQSRRQSRAKRTARAPSEPAPAPESEPEAPRELPTQPRTRVNAKRTTPVQVAPSPTRASAVDTSALEAQIRALDERILNLTQDNAHLLSARNAYQQQLATARSRINALEEATARAQTTADSANAAANRQLRERTAELERVQRELESLQQALEDERLEIRRLTETNAAQRRELEELRTYRSNNEAQNYPSRLRTLERDHADLTGRLEEAENNLNTTLAELEAARAANGEFTGTQAQVIALTAELARVQALNTDLNARLDAFVTSLERERATIARLNDDLATENANVVLLNHQLTDIQAQLNDARTEANEAQRTNTTLTRRVEELTQRTETAERNYQEAETLRIDLANQVAQAQQALKTQNGENERFIEELNARNAAAVEARSTIAEELRVAQQTNDELSANLQDVQTKLSRAYTNYATIVGTQLTIENERDELQSALETERNTTATLEGELAAAQTEAQHVREQNAGLQTQINTMRNAQDVNDQIAGLNTTIDELRANVTELGTQNAALAADLAQLQVERDNAFANIETLQNELGTVTASSEEQVNRASVAEQTLATRTAEVETLTRQLNDVTAQRARLNDEMEVRNTELDTLQETLTAVRTDLNAARADATASDNRIETLENTLTATRADLDAALEDVDARDSEIAQLEEQIGDLRDAAAVQAAEMTNLRQRNDALATELEDLSNQNEVQSNSSYGSAESEPALEAERESESASTSAQTSARVAPVTPRLSNERGNRAINNALSSSAASYTPVSSTYPNANGTPIVSPTPASSEERERGQTQLNALLNGGSSAPITSEATNGSRRATQSASAPPIPAASAAELSTGRRTIESLLGSPPGPSLTNADELKVPLTPESPEISPTIESPASTPVRTPTRGTPTPTNRRATPKLSYIHYDWPESDNETGIGHVEIANRRNPAEARIQILMPDGKTDLMFAINPTTLNDTQHLEIASTAYVSPNNDRVTDLTALVTDAIVDFFKTHAGKKYATIKKKKQIRSFGAYTAALERFNDHLPTTRKFEPIDPFKEFARELALRYHVFNDVPETSIVSAGETAIPLPSDVPALPENNEAGVNESQVRSAEEEEGEGALNATEELETPLSTDIIYTANSNKPPNGTPGHIELISGQNERSNPGGYDYLQLTGSGFTQYLDFALPPQTTSGATMHIFYGVRAVKSEDGTITVYDITNPGTVTRDTAQILEGRTYPNAIRNSIRRYSDPSNTSFNSTILDQLLANLPPVGVPEELSLEEWQKELKALSVAVRNPSTTSSTSVSNSSTTSSISRRSRK